MTTGSARENFSEAEANELSQLLVGATREEIKSLLAHVENKEGFAEHMGDSLGKAVSRASQDKRFLDAMAPVVTDGVLATARQQPKKLGDAIAPALGPAIRQSIMLAVDRISERTNATLEQNFSLNAIKWRLEAKRTGRSLGEVVVSHTVVFRVEHVFMIHAETGSLLLHVAAPDALGKDPALVSSMLSAVRDFVGEAFTSDAEEDSADSETNAAEHSFGDQQLITERAGGLVLAWAVRGRMGSEHRTETRKKAEMLSLQFAHEVENFDGDPEPFEQARMSLEACLVEKKVREKKKSAGMHWSRKVAIATGLLLLLGLFGFRLYTKSGEQKRWLAFQDRVENTPGIILVSAGKPDAKFIKVLRDPLALPMKEIVTEGGYAESNIDWSETAFISLEPGIVLQRAKEILSSPETISLSWADDRVLKVEGTATGSWIERAQTAYIPGVSSLNIERVKQKDGS